MDKSAPVASWTNSKVDDPDGLREVAHKAG